jgi:hypothetical protein
MHVYVGPSLRPQPQHRPEDLARIVRVPPGAAAGDPRQSREDPRRGYTIAKAQLPVRGDRAGDKTPDQRDTYALLQARLLRHFAADPQPRTIADLVRHLGSAHSSTSAAVRNLYRDRRLQRRRAPGPMGNKNSHAYWLAGQPAPAIAPTDGGYPITDRILALLADRQVYTGEAIGTALGITKRVAGGAVRYLTQLGRIELRACMYPHGRINQYRWRQDGPWPGLPEGWRERSEGREERSEGREERGERGE